MDEWLSFSATKFSATKDVILVVLAIYGAALTTFSVRQVLRKGRRFVLVKSSTVMHAYGSELGPCIAELEAINTGQRSVTITELALSLPGNKRIVPFEPSRYFGLPNTPLPTTLTDGQSASFYIAYRELGRALLAHGYKGKAKLTPICIDAVGRTYRGRIWKAHAAELARM